ncbi:uncharacterized protein LOC121367552 isoform X2 [Gigantopelta aegis]|uniref:uncharacterized protein LOC121367552 isoform X2 n=1 Tax=Gigantopelta aegis TaxID=1735272 RepID=UPI001B88807A|nr:uncharacterized protein LOC121367552 isoform X2 [Gigantopelta aegis]
MAGLRRLLIFLKRRNLVLIFLTVLYNCCKGCSPPENGVIEPPEMTTKFHFSTYVVYGKVTGINPGSYDYDSLYTTEMDVYCVFKGGPIPKKISITYSGFEPGLCRANNYTVGGLYIAYMDDGDGPGVYRSSQGYEEDIGEDQTLDDVPMICGVVVDYPIGVTDKSVTWYCPDSYPDYEGCLEYVEKTDVPLKIDITPPTKEPAAGTVNGVGGVKWGDGQPGSKAHA